MRPMPGKGGQKMKLSLAITTYNRYEMTIESFAQVIDDPRIDDIVILDDSSTDGSYEKLRDHLKDNSKVRVIKQAQNRGMSLNKRDAIALAKNEWVIIFDSDNIISSDYLNAFYEQIKRDGRILKNCIYMPDFAKPQFDYRKFAGMTYGAMLLPPVHDDMCNCLMNTCNYIVNRDAYQKVYQYNPDHICSDTVWFNYNWLKEGNAFYVVPGMEYFHRVHDGSGFLENADYNMKKSAEVRKLIMRL